MEELEAGSGAGRRGLEVWVVWVSGVGVWGGWFGWRRKIYEDDRRWTCACRMTSEDEDGRRAEG